MRSFWICEEIGDKRRKKKTREDRIGICVNVLRSIGICVLVTFLILGELNATPRNG